MTSITMMHPTKSNSQKYTMTFEGPFLWSELPDFDSTDHMHNSKPGITLWSLGNF
jgi:hypothetical protein